MMFKKLILASAVSAVVMTTSAQAVEVGIASDMGLSIVAQFNQFNFVLGDNGLAVDYKILTGKFDAQTPLTWYVGAGAYAGWDHGLGVRAPLGIEWDFAKGWELYAQVHPELDFDNDVDFGIDGALGVRYSF